MSAVDSKEELPESHSSTNCIGQNQKQAGLNVNICAEINVTQLFSFLVWSQVTKAYYKSLYGFKILSCKYSFFSFKGLQ